MRNWITKNTHIFAFSCIILSQNILVLYLETDQRQTGGVTHFSFRNLHNLRALTHLDPVSWVYFFTNKYNKHVFCKNIYINID